MRYEEIQSVEEALLYYASCQLATVDELAMKKSRGKGDYERQKSIAQKMCDTIKEFGISPGKGDSRVAEVFKSGSVEAYAKNIERKFGTEK